MPAIERRLVRVARVAERFDPIFLAARKIEPAEDLEFRKAVGLRSDLATRQHRRMGGSWLIPEFVGVDRRVREPSCSARGGDRAYGTPHGLIRVDRETVGYAAILRYGEPIDCDLAVVQGTVECCHDESIGDCSGAVIRRAQCCDDEQPLHGSTAFISPPRGQSMADRQATG
jgi:hypothetical protein